MQHDTTQERVVRDNTSNIGYSIWAQMIGFVLSTAAPPFTHNQRSIRARK